jgi:hypothetical protein
MSFAFRKRTPRFRTSDREPRDIDHLPWAGALPSNSYEPQIAMSQLMRFPSSVRRDPAIEVWMHEHSGELGAIAQRWFKVMRGCGDDVRELLHDGHPTACVADAAFGYVNSFKAHVNVGFFRGAELADPDGLLEGSGKFMRHVKLRPEREVDPSAVERLIETAYIDMKRRLRESSPADGC